jgi:hypothetical protein
MASTSCVGNAPREWIRGTIGFDRRRFAPIHTESCTVRLFRFAGVLALLSLCIAAGKRPEVAVPSTEPGAVAPPTGETIPQNVLDEMFRVELGPAYDPVQAPQLYDAHRLIEQYFLARTAAERKSVVGQLEATQIDPNILGRLCRIREHWPALAGGGVFYVNQKVGPREVRYFLGIPKAYDRTKAWPMVVDLPEATAFVANPAPSAAQVVKIYTDWISAELAKHPDAIVLMPLLNLDELYGPGYAGMNSVIDPVRDAPEHANIDPARVYLRGHSLGAVGVWQIAIHYPTYFASINVLAGSATEEWQQIRLMNLRNVLPVVWHDEADPVIKIGFARTLVNALRAEKVPVDFTETKGLGHTPSESVVESEYQMMRSRTRSLYPRQAWLQTNRPDVALNRSDWLQIYQELNTGREHIVPFRHGTAHMTLYQITCSIKAEVANNRINATNDNVSTLRFYLNDQLVNMAAPVQVVIDKKEKFKGIVKPSIDVMLKDQLVLGRGWRYYTGAVDIDMVPPPATQPTTRSATRPHKGKITVGPSPEP